MITQMDPLVRDKHEFLPQAILKEPPAFFAGKGVSFQSGVDDLNEFKVAELVVGGVPFALMRHEGTPLDETEVLLPDYIPISRIAEVIRLILKEFGLPSDAVGWHRQRADTPY